jgi:transcription elongation factor GreA
MNFPMTVRGSELLKKELQQLKSVERPSVIQAISDARANGDLSENADYDAAKERQGFVEGRIAEIEGKLGNAVIIVMFGATIDLEDLDNEQKVTYQIVGEDEADIKKSMISVGSPIARALIGKSEGDIVEVRAPGGVREYEIIAVKYI